MIASNSSVDAPEPAFLAVVRHIDHVARGASTALMSFAMAGSSSTTRTRISAS
jgi:hypothetical protein